MPQCLRPPSSLKELDFFVLRYNRDTEEYELLIPSRESYLLGDAFATRRYFRAMDMEHLGGRAMDSALAFGASQAIPAEKRAYGLDLCKIDLDPEVTEENREDERRRELGISGRTAEEVALWQAV